MGNALRAEVRRHVLLEGLVLPLRVGNARGSKFSTHRCVALHKFRFEKPTLASALVWRGVAEWLVLELPGQKERPPNGR